MTRVGSVFRIEVVSDDMLYTKEIVAEVKKVLLASPHITQVKIDELYEDITLFKKKVKK